MKEVLKHSTEVKLQIDKIYLNKSNNFEWSMYCL